MNAAPARELDDAAPGAEAPAVHNVRRCLVTGENHDRSRLLRFVVGPDNSVVPDVDGRLPGRGLWLTPRRDIVAAAAQKGAFAKAAKASVTVAAGLEDRVEALLVQRSIALLGLARRAGQAVAGFTQVDKVLRDGKVAVLVEAAEGAPDGRGKLARLAPSLPVTDLLSIAELAQAFGREHVVHAALLRGKLAESFLAEQARLAGFRKTGTERE